MRWAALALALLLVFAACGDTTSDSSTHSSGGQSTGATAGSSGIGGSTGGTAGTAGSGGGIFLIDASVGGTGGSAFQDGAVLTDASLFMCGSCVCDGSTHYCLIVAGGFQASIPPDAALCSSDAGFDGCTPLPSSCGTTPACSCIDPPYGGACQCSDVGGGLEVFCALP